MKLVSAESVLASVLELVIEGSELTDDGFHLSLSDGTTLVVAGEEIVVALVKSRKTLQ